MIMNILLLFFATIHCRSTTTDLKSEVTSLPLNNNVNPNPQSWSWNQSVSFSLPIFGIFVLGFAVITLFIITLYWHCRITKPSSDKTLEQGQLGSVEVINNLKKSISVDRNLKVNDVQIPSSSKLKQKGPAWFKPKKQNPKKLVALFTTKLDVPEEEKNTLVNNRTSGDFSFTQSSNNMPSRIKNEPANNVAKNVGEEKTQFFSVLAQRNASNSVSVPVRLSLVGKNWVDKDVIASSGPMAPRKSKLHQSVSRPTTPKPLSKFEIKELKESIESLSTQKVENTGVTKSSETLYQCPTMMDDSIKIMSLPGHLLINNPNAFRLRKRIGKGGGGDVSYVDVFDNDILQRTNNQKLVAKVMISGGHDAFVQEVAIMSMFVSHNNFSKIVGFEMETMTLLMICYSGSLTDWIRNPVTKHLESILILVTGTCTAIKSLHNTGIVHNDIKPANILIEENPLCPKLTDFGVSNIIDSSTLVVKAFEVHNRKGMSVSYAAPERFAKLIPTHNTEQVIKSVDVYSLGICLSEIITRREPWKKP